MNENEVAAIERIVESKQIIEVNGLTYARADYRVVEPRVKRPDVVMMNTLLSLAEFLKNTEVNDVAFGLFLLIDNNMEVSLYSGVDMRDSKRTLLANASNQFRQFEFDKFHSSEYFNIMLQTRFVYEDGDAKKLFATMSKLQIDEGIKLSDDGMTQQVTIKRGMSAASAEAEAVKTRMTLSPYRIFPECDQPRSEFLVRIKGSKEEGAHVGLWETDGGMWTLQAKQIIHDKLKSLGVLIPIYC